MSIELKNFISQLLKNLKKRKVYSTSRDNIWGNDLADMQLISKFSKGFRFYYVLLIFLSNIPGLFL